MIFPKIYEDSEGALLGPGEGADDFPNVPVRPFQAHHHTFSVCDLFQSSP